MFGVDAELQEDFAKLSKESKHLQRGFWQICAHEGRQQALLWAAQALGDAQAENLALQTIQSQFAKDKKRIETMVRRFDEKQDRVRVLLEPLNINP